MRVNTTPQPLRTFAAGHVGSQPCPRPRLNLRPSSAMCARIPPRLQRRLSRSHAACGAPRPHVGPCRVRRQLSELKFGASRLTLHAPCPVAPPADAPPHRESRSARRRCAQTDRNRTADARRARAREWPQSAPRAPRASRRTADQQRPQGQGRSGRVRGRAQPRQSSRGRRRTLNKCTTERLRPRWETRRNRAVRGRPVSCRFWHGVSGFMG